MDDIIPSAFVPGSHMAAAHGLVNFDIVQSSAFKKRRLSAPIEDAHPCILKFARAVLNEAERRGWPFFAHQYYRGQKEQELVLARGSSRAKWGQSPHNFGMAVDIVHYGRYWDLNTKEWAVLGLMGKEVARRQNLKITWGGDWKFYDPAHWELTDWKKRVQNGE